MTSGSGPHRTWSYVGSKQNEKTYMHVNGCAREIGMKAWTRAASLHTDDDGEGLEHIFSNTKPKTQVNISAQSIICYSGIAEKCITEINMLFLYTISHRQLCFICSNQFFSLFILSFLHLLTCVHIVCDTSPTPTPPTPPVPGRPCCTLFFFYFVRENMR
jgi:hypothetical protein